MKDVGPHRQDEPCRASKRLAKVYEARVEDYTRAAEQTDDQVFRRMLLTLALQFTLAAQEEGAKSKQ